MIWPREATLLARTKLKTRKVRLIVTVIITALLFGVLIFLASLTDGVTRSLKSFTTEGYGGSFYVQATPLTYQYEPSSNQAIIDYFSPLQRDLVIRKKAYAKKLNISYDETVDTLLPLQSYKSGPSTTEVFPNFSSPLVTKYLTDKNAAVPGSGFNDFSELAHKAGAVNLYRGTVGNSIYSGPLMNAGQTSVLIDGKENYVASDTSAQNPFDGTTGVASIMSLGWRSMDDALLAPFVLPGQSVSMGDDKSVPVIAPFSAAEEILGLKALPATAKSDEKLARLVEVREAIAGKTAQLCYRNGPSSELLNQAIQQQKEIEQNKNNKEYTQPALLYKLPATPCGETTIKSDKRTEDEKKEFAARTAFDKEFGNYVDPIQGVLTIKIIGVNADVSFGPSISPAAILTSLFTSSVGTGWVSPATAIDANPFASNIQGGTAATAPRASLVYYAQFNTYKEMEAFIDSQACKDLSTMDGPDGVSRAVDFGSGTGVDACIAQGSVFNVAPYGNSAGAVEQFRSGIWKVAKYAILVIVLLASLIMMGNIGKIISDSRRETAVFRSLGAKRLDIAQIYLTYTIMISLLVVCCALVLGTIGSMLINSHFSKEVSVAAVLAYNASDVHKSFVLYGFNALYVGVIGMLVIVSGTLSAALPLLRNTRRNPIRDMRDES